MIGISTSGFGGTNAHAVLKHWPVKTNSKIRPRQYRLVVASGRTSEAVNSFLDGIERNKSDPEFLALVDEIHKINIDGHGYRG